MSSTNKHVILVAFCCCYLSSFTQSVTDETLISFSYPGTALHLQKASGESIPIKPSAKDSLLKVASKHPITVMLGGQINFSSSATMLGASFSVLSMLKNHARSYAGLSIGYSHFLHPDDGGVPFNVVYNLNMIDAGFRLLAQIKSFVFFNFNPQLLLGFERVDTYYHGQNPGRSPDLTVSTMLIGLEIDGGIYLIRPEKAGPYLGTDLLIRFTSSDAFQTGVGFKLSMGIKF